MSSVPHLSTKGFKVWLAGHGAYRPQAKELFEQLAAGIARQTGNQGHWAALRDALGVRR